MILTALALALQPTPVVPAGETFRCTPVAIYDADGPIWCQEGPRVRLNAVAAREADGTCRAGHPCPAMMPEQARAETIRALGAIPAGRRSTGHINLRGASTMTCVSSGHARGRRTGATCMVGGQQLNCLVIRSQAGAFWPQYDRAGLVRRALARGCR